MQNPTETTAQPAPAATIKAHGLANHLSPLQALRLVAGNGPDGCDQAAWSRLTNGLETLSTGQIQQRLAAEGIEISLDGAADLKIDAALQRPHAVVAAVDPHNENARAAVDMGDGSGLLHDKLLGDPSIVEQAETPTVWSTSPGYHLTRQSDHFWSVNDRDRFHPGTVDAWVHTFQLNDDPQACTCLCLKAGAAELEVRLSSANARKLAAEILAGADVLEAFEAERDAVNAMPFAYGADAQITRVDIADGVVAFETATVQGGAA